MEGTRGSAVGAGGTVPPRIQILLSLVAMADRALFMQRTPMSALRHGRDHVDVMIFRLAAAARIMISPRLIVCIFIIQVISARTRTRTQIA
jgi:hypothetical protein